MHIDGGVADSCKGEREVYTCMYILTLCICDVYLAIIEEFHNNAENGYTIQVQKPH